VAGIFLYVRALQRHKDPIVAAYERLCRKLAKTGIERAAHEGPVDYWWRLQQARPQIAEAAAPLFERYVALRYAESASGSSRVVRDFAWLVWRFSF
jgi:hypothetical protein